MALFTPPLEPAVTLAIMSGGVFFLTALVTGAWKWQQTMASDDNRAHVYVDIAHRASLLYAFAALLLATFAQLSDWSETIDLVATAIPLALFAVAISTYIWHGLRQRTDNQFAERNIITTWGTLLLTIGEIGGFVVLFWGAARVLLGA